MSYKAEPSPAHSPALSMDLTGEGEAYIPAAPNDNKQLRDKLAEVSYERQRLEENFENLNNAYEGLETRHAEEIEKGQSRDKEMRDLKSRVEKMEKDSEIKEDYIKSVEDSFGTLEKEVNEKDCTIRKLESAAEYNKQQLERNEADINRLLKDLEQQGSQNSDKEVDTTHSQSQSGEQEGQESTTFREDRLQQQGTWDATDKADQAFVVQETKASESFWSEIPANIHLPHIREPYTPDLRADTLEAAMASARSDDHASNGLRSPEDRQDVPQTATTDFDSREGLATSEPNLSSLKQQKTSDLTETEACPLCAGTGQSRRRHLGIFATFVLWLWNIYTTLMQWPWISFVLMLAFDMYMSNRQYSRWMQANKVPPGVLDGLRNGGRRFWMWERWNYHVVLALGVDRVILG